MPCLGESWNCLLRSLTEVASHLTANCYYNFRTHPSAEVLPLFGTKDYRQHGPIIRICDNP
jgi:hypothetical protein